MKNYTIFFIVFIFLSCSINSQPVSQTFNSSGTYIVPAGYSAIVTIQALGAGGGGGTNSGNAKGGGGGGAFASISTTLTAGSYAVTVGIGGGPSVAGGNSSFASLVIAAGGSSTTSSTGGAGGTVAASTGTIRYAGGNGGNGGSTTGIRGGGGGGGSAFPFANGGNGGNGVAGGLGTGGAGGIGAGDGGRGADNDGSPDATAGVLPGGGGGGRGNNGNSQAGANGQVIVTVNSVLPVKFGDIKAFEKQSAVQIEWSTYSERKVSHFEIQRSGDGRSFTTIGQVNARNLNYRSDYNWQDASPLTNYNFYRIKSVDIDSKTDYSAIVKISFKKTSSDFSVYPNPAINKQISFQAPGLEKGDYVLTINNIAGQQLYRKNFSVNGGAISQSVQLPSSIRPGMYNLQLANNFTVLNKAFIVQ